MVEMETQYANNKKEWFEAVNSGDLEKMKKMIEQGFLVNDKEEYGEKRPAIIVATANKDMETVLFLIDRNADVNARNVNNDTALTSAICAGCVEIAELLLKKTRTKIYAIDGVIPLFSCRRYTDA